VGGVLVAETAILAELDAVGVVLLVLESIVVPLLALSACQCDFDAHSGNLLYFTARCRRFANYVPK
jgi:hypothetical protein